MIYGIMDGAEGRIYLGPPSDAGTNQFDIDRFCDSLTSGFIWLMCFDWPCAKTTWAILGQVFVDRYRDKQMIQEMV